MSHNTRRKIDWPSWIGASIVLGTAFCSIGGFLFNQRVVPKEKEVDAHFVRIEKEVKEKYDFFKKEIEEIRHDVDKKDEKREEESKKLLALLHSIDIQLAKFNVGFESMKSDIKELKEKD